GQLRRQVARPEAALLVARRLFVGLQLLDRGVVLLDRGIAGGHVVVGRLLAVLDVLLDAVGVLLHLAVEGAPAHVRGHDEAAGIFGLRAAIVRRHVAGLLRERGAGKADERHGECEFHGLLSGCVAIHFFAGAAGVSGAIGAIGASVGRAFAWSAWWMASA